MKQERRKWGERCTPAQLNNVASRIDMHNTTPCVLLSLRQEVVKVHMSLPVYQNAHVNFLSNFLHLFRRGNTFKSLYCWKCKRALGSSCTQPLTCGNQHIQNICTNWVLRACLLSCCQCFLTHWCEVFMTALLISDNWSWAHSRPQ